MTMSVDQLMYLVVTATNSGELQVNVTKFLRDGWEPQGGVSFSCYQGYQYGDQHDLEIWAQAMIKRE